MRIFRGHSRSIRCLKVISEYLFASGSDDSSIKVWTWTSDECKQTLVGHSSAVYCLEINHLNSQLISCSLDKTIRVWDLNVGVCVQILKGHADTVSCIRWQTSTSLLYSSGSFENVIKVWDLSLGKCLQTYHVNSFVSRIELCKNL